MRGLILGLVALVAACTRSAPADAAPAVTEPSAPEILETPLHLPPSMRDHAWISIERTACYGACPQFTMTATSSGAVEWIGRQDVHRLGPAYRVVDAAAVAELYAAYADLDWLEIPQRSHGTEEGCATDAPSTIVTLGRGVVSRTLHDYHGCRSEARTQMRALDKRLVELLAAPDWIEGDPALRPDPTCRAAVFRPLFTARSSAPWSTFTDEAVSAFSSAVHQSHGETADLRIVAFASGDPAFVESIDRLEVNLQRHMHAYESIAAKVVEPASTGPGAGEIRVVVTPKGCPVDDAALVDVR